MTVACSLETCAMEVDSISLGDSSLFPQPPLKDDTTELNLQQSSLFNESSFDGNENDESELNLQLSLLFNNTAEQGPIDSTPESSETMQIDDLEYISPICLPMKEVRLLNGSTIKLQPRSVKRIKIDDTPLEGTYMDMDILFSGAKLLTKIKENKKKLDQETAEVSPETQLAASTAQQIWTEKYKPNSFIELCSAGNDGQYRHILHWLKKWSSVVFGGESNSNPEQVDALGRPHRKILLIHGPPGIGKTVITHILAKQMGYSIQELNASNSMDTLPQSGAYGSNNGSSALKLKIVNAMTSNTVVNASKKPSCLVIDEIDSLVNANDVVKILNELIQADQRATWKKLKRLVFDEGENKKPNKKKDILLNRPIICIANDIYSNSNGKFGINPMDKLRPICEIVQLRKPMSTKTISGKKLSGNGIKSIKDHLMWINQRENLGLDNQEVSEIVEICDGDIRACINHIQFNGRKMHTRFDDERTKVNGSSGRSSMDKQISWFGMVDQLFKRDGQMSKDENFMHLLERFMSGSGKSVVSNTSSFDKVMKGVFNKYLDVVHLQDDSLRGPCILSDWLGFYDQLGILQDNQYTTLVGLKVWSLFSEINPQRISQSLIPNAKNLEFESYEGLKHNRNVVKRVAENLPIQTQLSLGMNLEVVSTYFLPYLSKILSPSLSSKLKSNLNETEKIQVEKITELVKDFNLALENVKDTETGIATLRINPNWETITIFENEYAPFPVATMQKHIQFRRQSLFPLIVAEMERLDMIRKSKNTNKGTLKHSRADEELQHDITSKKIKIENSVDFFKGKYQQVNSKISTTRNSNDQEAFKPARIWVKYNEGFSNAVRKNIGWNDLWSL